MNARPHRTLRRELESELRDVPNPTPPDDLLARIRAEIPHDLRAANSEGPQAPAAPGSERKRRLPAFSTIRLAASIAIAVVGVGLGFRVISDREQKSRAALAIVPEPPRVELTTVPSSNEALNPETAATAQAESAPNAAPRRKVVEAEFGARSLPSAPAQPIPSEPAAPPASDLGATGETIGEVTDDKGQPLPGVTVELSNGGAPRLAVTDLQGQFRFDSVPAGQYKLETQLEGFAPLTYEQVVVNQNRSTSLSLTMNAATQETITITAESPLYDARSISAGATVDEKELEKTPTARDPWVILQTTPGTIVDRVHVGGNESGQRSSSSSAPSAAAPAPQAKAKSEPSLRDSRARQDADKLSSLGYVGGGVAVEPEVARERPMPAPAPPADMFFRPVEKNPFVDTAEDRLSTFGLDVDTGSWSLTRSYLDRGLLPPAEAIRAEEFVNAQSYDDPAPRRGDFTLIGEGAPSPFAPGDQYRLLRFAVKARELAAGDRKPANLTFVVDVSGSMSQENRLGLVKRALGLLLSELQRDDRVALVVYGSQGRVLLRHTRDHEAIREAIGRLVPDGSTNAEEGLRLGYDLAGEVWRRDAINRVILCSDGVANVGATGPESILGRIGSEARRGIELTTVGFGMGNYNDALMEQLADQGDGAYHYVDTLDEARRIFVENLTGTLQTVAKDAKVQVEFDPRVVERWRLIGYENRDVADRDFRNDAIDAGEIGVGHSAVALYEVRLAEGARSSDPLGTMRLRWKSRASKQVEEASLRLEVGDLEGSFRSSSNALRTAAVAAELAERLARSYWAQEGSWELLVRVAERLDERSSRRIDRDGGSLADTVRRAARLAGSDPLEPQRRPRTPSEERDEY